MHSATLRRNRFYPKDDPHLFKPLIAELLYRVIYLVPADDNVYVDCRHKVDHASRDWKS
jgi:glucan phosphorylase